jgi:hypothetical protein
MMTLRANFDNAATSIAHFTIIGCPACSRCLRQVSIAGLSRPPDKAHVLRRFALGMRCKGQRYLLLERRNLVVARLSVLVSVSFSTHSASVACRFMSASPESDRSAASLRNDVMGHKGTHALQQSR